MSHSLFANLGFNIVIPVVIMTRFTEQLGALPALLIALAFPLVYGFWDWYKIKKINFYSALGLVSVLLTGFIGVFELPAQYLAFKEASIPLLVALFFYFSSFTKFDATTKLLEQIFDLKKLHEAYKKLYPEGFSRPIAWVRRAFIGSFLFSVLANYLLAIIVVTAPPATTEFTAQIGTMTALSYVVILVPVLLLLLGTFYFLFWHIEKTTKKKYDLFLVKGL